MKALFCETTVISKTIQIRRTRHAGQTWRSKDETISDVLLWTASHGRIIVRRPRRTFNSSLWTQDVV